MEYKIFEGDFRPDFSWSYVLIKEIPSLDIMRCLMREGGFRRWQYRWLKVITISALRTSHCDAYTVNKEVKKIIIIYDGVLPYNLLENISGFWSHHQAMINTHRKVITYLYIALKKVFFLWSSDLDLYRTMNILGAEIRCNKFYSKAQSNYLWSAVSPRSQQVSGLWPLACWDLGFESHRGNGYLSVVSVVCCQVEVSATSWSLVQRSPTDCAASLCVI